MTHEQVCSSLYSRQTALLDRQGVLNDLMSELEEADNDDNTVTRTAAYRLMELEHKLIFDQLDYIDHLLDIINQK